MDLAKKHPGPVEASEALAQAGLELGSGDNITVLVVDLRQFWYRDGRCQGARGDGWASYRGSSSASSSSSSSSAGCNTSAGGVSGGVSAASAAGSAAQTSAAQQQQQQRQRRRSGSNNSTGSADMSLSMGTGAAGVGGVGGGGAMGSDSVFSTPTASFSINSPNSFPPCTSQFSTPTASFSMDSDASSALQPAPPMTTRHAVGHAGAFSFGSGLAKQHQQHQAQQQQQMHSASGATTAKAGMTIAGTSAVASSAPGAAAVSGGGSSSIFVAGKPPHQSQKMQPLFAVGGLSVTNASADKPPLAKAGGASCDARSGAGAGVSALSSALQANGGSDQQAVRRSGKQLPALQLPRT